MTALDTGRTILVRIADHGPNDARYEIDLTRGAASLLGAGNFGLAAVVAPLVGLIGSQSAASIGVVAVVGGTLAMTAIWTLVRPRTVPPIA